MDSYTVVYNELYKRLSNTLNIKVYDTTPHKNVPYPFLILEPMQVSVSTVFKGIAYIETFRLYIVAYGDYKDRGRMGEILNEAQKEILSIREINDCKINVKKSTIRKSISTDKSTNTTLLRGNLSLEIDYINGGF